MTVEPGSAEIVQLAWARRLGFDDCAFAAAAGVRFTRADNAARSVEFVRLFGSSAWVGPEWALDAAVGLSDEELAEHVTLLTISRAHGGHGLGAAALFFADDLPLQQPSEELTVSHGTRKRSNSSRSARPMTSTRWASGTLNTASRSCIWKTAGGRLWPAGRTPNGKRSSPI